MRPYYFSSRTVTLRVPGSRHPLRVHTTSWCDKQKYTEGFGCEGCCWWRTRAHVGHTIGTPFTLKLNSPGGIEPQPIKLEFTIYPAELWIYLRFERSPPNRTLRPSFQRFWPKLYHILFFFTGAPVRVHMGVPMGPPMHI